MSQTPPRRLVLLTTATCYLLNVSVLGLAWCVLAARAQLPPRNAHSPIGTNVHKASSGEMLWYTDQMRRSGPWLTQSLKTGDYVWDTGEQEQLQLDDNGWVISFGDNPDRRFTHIAVAFFLGTSQFAPAGEWVVLYEGQGGIDYGVAPLVTVTVRYPGRDVLTLTPQADSHLLLQISTIDPANHLRNIRVIPPGGICDGDPFAYAARPSECGGGLYESFEEVYATYPFHPLLLRELRSYKSLRFMQWQGIVEVQTPDTWATRSRLSDAIWGRGWNQSPPYELIFLLSNTLDADPWVHIPHWADDDYVRDFARLAHAQSEPELNVYVEYSNEIWNLAYPFSIYGDEVEAWAQARWPSTTYAYGAPIKGFTKRMNFVGMRTQQICDIWREEFGADAERVRCVVAGGPDDDPAVDALACPLYAAEAAIPDCAAHIYAVAVAPYFAEYIDDRLPAEGGNFDQISAWTQQSDGGLDSLFLELATGTLLRHPVALGGALANPVVTMRRNKWVADLYGLHLIAYEGGLHLSSLSALGTQCNDSNHPACPPYRAIQALYVAASRDPRMGLLYADYLDAWRAEGGELFVHYHAIGQPSTTWGSWGAKEYVGQLNTQAPKYQAIQNFIEANPCWWEGCSYPDAAAAAWTATPTRTTTAPAAPVPTRTPPTSMATINGDNLDPGWECRSWNTPIDFAAATGASASG